MKTDTRTYRHADLLLYGVLGLYILIYLLWFFGSRGGAITDSATTMIFLLPSGFLLTLITAQSISRRLRFSGLANIIAIGSILGSAGVALLIIGAASAVA